MIPLILTSHWPTAPAYGIQQRVMNTARLLSRLGRLSFAIVQYAGQADEESICKTKSHFNVQAVSHARRLARENSSARIEYRLRHEFDPNYMVTHPWALTELGEALGERAFKRFVQRWTWDSFERPIRTVVEQCLAGTNRTTVRQPGEVS